ALTEPNNRNNTSSLQRSAVVIQILHFGQTAGAYGLRQCVDCADAGKTLAPCQHDSPVGHRFGKWDIGQILVSGAIDRSCTGWQYRHADTRRHHVTYRLERGSFEGTLNAFAGSRKARQLRTDIQY